MRIHFDTIDSTNTYAKKEYHFFPADEITCITADYQTAGRGQFGRKWVSPKGKNLLVSLCFRLPHPFLKMPELSYFAASTLHQFLKEKEVVTTFKWPNDLLIHGKKVAGILCETISEQTYTQVIIGIGLNLNMEIEDFIDVDQPATSLYLETKNKWKIELFLNEFYNYFATSLNEWLR